jgi:hypothetical protein
MGTKLNTFCTGVFLKTGACEVGVILYLHMCGCSTFQTVFDSEVPTLPSTICVGYERVPV